jgi:hypothetical protein
VLDFPGGVSFEDVLIFCVSKMVDVL